MSLQAPGDDAPLRHRLKYAPRATAPAHAHALAVAPAPGTTRLDADRIKPARVSAKLAVNDSRNRCTTRAPTYRKLRTGPAGDTPIPIKIQFESGIHLTD